MVSVAINLCCYNSECKFYWECMCMLNVCEKIMYLDSEGKCESFKKGRSEWYEKEGEE